MTASSHIRPKAIIGYCPQFSSTPRDPQRRVLVGFLKSIVNKAPAERAFLGHAKSRELVRAATGRNAMVKEP